MLKRAIAAITCWLFFVGNAMAGESNRILEITGLITDDSVTLDFRAVHDLPITTIETSTVVTDGIHSFTGFLMRDLLEKVQSTGETVTAIALNDYAVDIPITDFYDYDVVVAYEMDGETLMRDDKGPLWIVYPRDDHQALQDIRFDYRWVWQLYQIDIK